LHFLQRSRFVKFSLFKNIGYVPGYYRYVASEELTYLRLCHPKGFTLEPDIQLQPLV
jgi:hypothetical protein